MILSSNAKRCGFIIIFTALILVDYLSLCLADTVILKDGREIKGQILEETKEEIKLRDKSGIMSFKKEEIKDIKKGETAGDLILTESGVEDIMGSQVPRSPFETEMMLSQFENFDPELRNESCERYYSLAQEYEAKSKTDTIREMRQARLMMALIYYKIAVSSSNKSIKSSSQSAIERCSAQLFNPRKEEIVIPFGTSMTEHINLFIKNLDSEKEKEKYAGVYLELGQDYGAKANTATSPEERLKNLQITINCYQIVMDYSPSEEMKIKANKALSGAPQKTQNKFQPPSNKPK